MSDRRLFYVAGEPGVGKSTLMREVTSGWSRAYLEKEPGRAPARDLLADTTHAGQGRIVAVEIGRVREQFSGTDALPSNCIDDAVAYLQSGLAAREAPLLLAEGARLSVRRFLQAAVNAGWRVQLLHIEGEELAAERRTNRAHWLRRPEQNPSWVKGRRTACRKLAAEAPSWGVEVLAASAEALEQDDAYREAVVRTAREGAPDYIPR